MGYGYGVTCTHIAVVEAAICGRIADQADKLTGPGFPKRVAEGNFGLF